MVMGQELKYLKTNENIVIDRGEGGEVRSGTGKYGDFSAGSRE
jgi:hypothetical protein